MSKVKSSKSVALKTSARRKRAAEPWTIKHVWCRLTRKRQETLTGLAASMVVSNGIAREKGGTA